MASLDPRGEYGKPRHRRSTSSSCEFFAQASTDSRALFPPVIVIRYPSTMNNDTEISIFSSRPLRRFFLLACSISFFFFLRPSLLPPFFFFFLFARHFPAGTAPDTLGKPRYKVHSRFPGKPGETPRRGGTSRKEPEKVSRIKLQTRGVNLYGVKTPTRAEVLVF